MPRKYITNPKTGRRVLADGPTGRKILKARRAKRARKATARKAVACRQCAPRRPATRRRRPTTYRRRPATRYYDDDLPYFSMADAYGVDIDLDL